MRVIRPGEIEVECSRCHSLLSVSASDISEDMHGDPNQKPYFFRCGACSKNVFLTSQEIPHWMLLEMGP